MKKIILIIKREYLTRVKKKSFIIMTILGPILMAAMFIIPAYISQKSDKEKTIGIVDETNLFVNKFVDTENLKFKILKIEINKAKNIFSESNLYAILYIPKNETDIPNSCILYSNKQPNIIVKGNIKNIIKKEVESIKLKKTGIDKKLLDSIETKIDISTIKINKQGQEEEESSTELIMAIGFIAGFLIYIFVFMYGAMVMRGFIEEKSNRIVEILISSVKPFQLMMGKIVGIALVGLTQFVLWILFTFAIVGFYQTNCCQENFNIKNFQETQISQNNIDLNSTAQLQQINTDSSDVNKILHALGSIDFGLIIFSFLFYFIGGYLLYAAMFAAIGAAVDNEADTQQFMLPITIPLIIALLMAQFVINNPDGPVAFWLSIIPFTSPIIMMVRIPFGVTVFDLVLSMVLLIGGFLFTTWIASKIFRTGILMYGKKISYKELWKWLKY